MTREEIIGDCRLVLGDCLEILPTLGRGAIDMVLTDPPYGTTACKWDAVIPFDEMWLGILHCSKPNAAICMTASQPFTSALVMSNPKNFRYEWIWEKSKASNFLKAREQPLKTHESVVVFSAGAAPYYPQKTQGDPYSGEKRAGKRGSNSEVTNNVPNPCFRNGSEDGSRFPRSVQYFPTAESEGHTFHPTQKPIDLMGYLIRTYTSGPGLVLDFTMGSGTTGVACVELGRKFVGIEIDPVYFDIACRRIEQAVRKQSCKLPGFSAKAKAVQVSLPL